MFAVVTDRAPVQKMTSLTMAPKPRLNFLSAGRFDVSAGQSDGAAPVALLQRVWGALQMPQHQSTGPITSVLVM